MNKAIITILVILMATVFSGTAVSGITSLRGDHELDAASMESGKRETIVVKGGIERSYKIQPPVIPHEIDKDEINLKVNTCMNCHSEKTYKQKNAPKAGDTHYINRDGKTTENVASRRYFCNQCHAPQLTADPLVENNFAGAK